MITRNAFVGKFKLQASCIKHKKQHHVKVLLNCHKTKHITPQLSTLIELPQVSKAKAVTNFVARFLSDVSLISHCTVSFHEARLWALPISWYRCLSWSLLWTRISTLVFDRVGHLKNLFFPCNIAFVLLYNFYSDISFISNFSVYSGHHTILIPPGDLETNPALWLSVVSQYKGKYCFLL